MNIIDPEFGRLPPALVTELERAGYTLRAPITKSRLDALVAATGSLPEDVIHYLATSDGLDHPRRNEICGSEEMLKPSPSSSLLPLEEDGSGNYDCAIIEVGPAFGAVVFWDHETTNAEYLVASSVTVYLKLLCKFPRSQRWSSDGQSHDDFLRIHDPGAAPLLDVPLLLNGVGGAVELLEPVPGDPLPDGAREMIDPFTNKKVVLMPPTKYRTPPKRS